MARISVATDASSHIVTISGKLVARDLQRLERACGPALEERQPNLELVLRGLTGIDAAARAYVDRLLARGAIVRS